MTTIPALELVQVIPGVISAGGNQLAMNGLMLDNTSRIPVGSVGQFGTAQAVGNYFGLSSPEYQYALIYFNGFLNSQGLPGNLLMAQYTQGAVGAYLRGANVSGLSLAQLQAISGTLAITVDGQPRSVASLILTSATSFSAAAALIQAALNATPANTCSFTGSIAAAGVPPAFTASITGSVMTVTAVSAGVIQPGTLLAGGAVLASTIVTSQLTDATNGAAPGTIGTYAVTKSQVLPSTSLTGTYGVLTATAITTGTLSVGQIVAGGTTQAGTQIYGLGSGSGLTGTYYVSPSQTVTSGPLTTTAANVTCTYDSVSGAFVIGSGIVGPASTIGFASGTAAAPLFLTQATGAVTSPGSAAQTPGAFMTALAQAQQNWGLFMTLFDPDNGSGNVQKQAFAAWVNSTLNRFAYVCVDADASPTAVIPATASMGQILAAANSSGTILVYVPSTIALPYDKGALVLGWAASLNFSALNGRFVLKFRQQPGLSADVNSDLVYRNLIANGYTAYCVFATANQQFIWLADGNISGPFQWADSYVNQIWLNAALQQALVILLGTVGSIPYNQFGYDLIASAVLQPILQAVNFGAIRAGVTLSQTQAALVNAQTGLNVAPIVQSRGWYFQVQDAPPAVRQARQSPVCTLWYMDGQSVQKIVLNSILMQ